MVGARARRQQVAFALARGLSSRRACALRSVAPSTLGYYSRLIARDAPAVAAMRALSARYPRYGYRRIRIFLARAGHTLRSFKGIAVECRMVFDLAGKIASAAEIPGDVLPETFEHEHPYIRLASVFTTPTQDGRRLLVAAPGNADFSRLATLPNAENPYQLTDAARNSLTLGVLDGRWRAVPNASEGGEIEYEMDPERDTNGAGLVYFANYAFFLNFAELKALERAHGRRESIDLLARRVLLRRRIAYYGNASLTDKIRVHVSTFVHESEPTLIGLRYLI